MKQLQTNNYLVSFVVFFILYFSGTYIWTAIGLSLFFSTAVRFFYNTGRTVDIRDLIVLVPFIQWVVGPWLSYKFSTDTVFYYMSVTEEQYMQFVVPALFLFVVGIYLKVNKTTVNLHIILHQIQKKGYGRNLEFFFIPLGILANILIPLMPPSLMFFVFLIGNLQYVGLFLLMQNKQRKGKKILFFGVIGIMSVLAVSRGMFQLLLLWFTFLFIITSFINKTSNIKKVLIAVSILLVAFFIQSIKTEYRSIVWTEEGTPEPVGKTAVFSGLLAERLARTELLTSEQNINNIIARMNQGWIIARVMSYTPTYEPFAKGETIISAIRASFLPRFLFENKKLAGGRENFTRFTGRDLVGGTSMNLSILGEVYANFGKNGAIIFMFFFGFFLNLFYSFLMGQLNKHPVLLFFIPLIFFQVVKAETDFGMVLNYLIKASVFVALVFWGLKKFFNVKL